MDAAPLTPEWAGTQNHRYAAVAMQQLWTEVDLKDIHVAPPTMSSVHNHFPTIFFCFQGFDSLRVLGDRKNKQTKKNAAFDFVLFSWQLNKVPLLDLLTLDLRMALLIEERMNSGCIDGSVAAAV